MWIRPCGAHHRGMTSSPAPASTSTYAAARTDQPAAEPDRWLAQHDPGRLLAGHEPGRLLAGHEPVAHVPLRRDLIPAALAVLLVVGTLAAVGAGVLSVVWSVAEYIAG